MYRAIVTIATGLILLLAACGEAEGWASDDADLASEATPAATDPNQAVTESSQQTGEVEPSIDTSVERDPVAVIQEIAVDRENPDLELVYAMLPERYQVIEFGEFWVEALANSFPSVGIVGHPKYEFSAQTYGEYALVDWSGHPAIGWVLVEEDEHWRLEPGDLQLILSAHQAERPGEGLRIGIGQDGAIEREVSHDADHISFSLISISPVATGVDERGMQIVMDIQKRPSRTGPGDVVDSHLLTNTEIDLTSMQWTAGDETGHVEVLRTTAALSNDVLTLPGWTDDDLDTFAEEGPDQDRLPQRGYWATLLLVDVPNDADDVELIIDDVHVGPLDDEDVLIAGADMVFHSFRYVFPNETTEPILIGEAPELGEMPEALERPEVSEEDLPPIPDLADLLEIDSIDYEQDGDVIDTEVRVVADDLRLEPAGRVTLVWDDGVEIDAMFEVDQDGVLLRGVREEGSLDDEVVEVRFQQLIWLAGEDDEATIDERTIQTSLGDFEILSVRENRINMLPLGQRYVRGLSIRDAGISIRPSGSGAGFDENFRPQDLHIDFDEGVEELLGEEPLPASVEIWVAEPELTLSIDD